MEYNITHKYKNNQKFTFGTGIIIIQCFMLTIITLVSKWFKGEKIKKNITGRPLVIAAFFQCCAIYFTNLAAF